MDSVSFSIWFLIGAILVFFMQCGFAMVECGFTRAKNAGNIIMKNLMDFCIGAVVFIFLGYGLLVNPHVAGGFIDDVPKVRAGAVCMLFEHVGGAGQRFRVERSGQTVHFRRRTGQAEQLDVDDFAL